MSTKIRLKKSGETGNTPTDLELDYGELALNYADGVLYFKNSSNVIQQISGVTANSFETINANGSLIIADSNTDILTLSAGDATYIDGNGINDVITIGVRTSDSLESNDSTIVATSNALNVVYNVATSAYNKANSAAITVREVYATNANIVNSFANINTIQFDTESGMAVVDESNSTVTIKLNSTFKNWNINGNTGLVAFGLDTVNFITEEGISISANNANTPKSLVFSVPGLANAGNTVSVSTNSSGTLFAKRLNFVNTANVSVIVTDSGDGNANISLATTFTGAAGLMLSDRFTGTGACTQFALSQSASDARSFIFLNGVAQKPGVDYSVNNAVLTMNTAPANGTVLEARTFSAIDLTDVTKINSDNFVGDGTSNTFTLTESSGTTRTFVYIDGVSQRPTADYTVAGKTLTFAQPPLANTNVEVRTLSTVAIGNVSSIQSDIFAGTGACTIYTLGKTTITRGAFVFVDGVVQVPITDYNINGTVVTFTSPPEANAVIEIRSISDLNLSETGTALANGLHKFELTSKGSFFTNGGFSVDADSISRNYILKGTTTGNTETELFYNTNMRIPVNANTTVFYSADIVARRTDATGESAGFNIKGVVDNFSGTVADVGDLYELAVAEDDAELLVDARADDTNNSINIYVTGSTGKTIRWTALVSTVEVAQ